jgi:hypothetical protein
MSYLPQAAASQQAVGTPVDMRAGPVEKTAATRAAMLSKFLTSSRV